jgi:transcriptional regulator with XRE-family HTH domain
MSEFAKALNEGLNELERSQRWLAKRLNVDPATVSRWANGETRPGTPEMVIRIADVLRIHNPQQRQAMLLDIGYGYADGQGNSLPKADVQAQPADLIDVVGAVRIFFGKWLDDLKIGSNKQKRWELRLIAILEALVSQMTPRGLLIFLIVTGLWVITYRLVGPVLQWPLEDKAVQLAASIRFGVATLLIPLLVGILAKIDAGTQTPSSAGESFALLLLKLAGGLAGFYILAFGIIAVTLINFYLRGVAISTTTAWFLVGFPLLASYVCACVIPVKRHEKFSRFQLQGVDRVALIAFLCAGPCTAVFLYLERDMLQSQYFGILLFVVLVGYILWSYKQQNPHAVSNYLLIGIWGVALPCLVLFAPILLGNIHPDVNLYDLTVFAVHIIGQGVLVATIYVKQQAKIFWPVLFWIFVMELLALLVLIHDLLAGVIFLIVLGLILITVWHLGKSHLSRYLWIHDSFWIMQIAFVASIAAWAYAIFPPWAAALLYVPIIVVLAKWASSAGSKLSSDNLA